MRLDGVSHADQENHVGVLSAPLLLAIRGEGFSTYVRDDSSRLDGDSPLQSRIAEPQRDSQQFKRFAKEMIMKA